MKLRKIFSLSLALALQVMPLTRLFVIATPTAGSSFAIIAMWLSAAAAFLGETDAVSGASSISISPATATNGIPFSGIVQYSGAHAATTKSWEWAQNWNGSQSGCNTSYEIAPGLWLTNNAYYLVRIGGTPTASGTYSFTLIIHDGLGCTGLTDTRSASITINAGPTLPPSITTQPTNQTLNVGANTSFSVAANGSGPLNYQWRRNGTNVNAANSSTLAISPVADNLAGNYTVVVGNNFGYATSSVAILTVDHAPPTIAVTSPAPGVVVNPSLTILGVASDDIGIKNVECSLNGAPFQSATGTSSWATASLSLSSGTNNVRVFSEDLAGNFSATNTVTYIYNRPDKISILVSGAGQVSGATNGQVVPPGNLLKLKAVPASGNIFSNWVATVNGTPAFVSNSPTLTVPMALNLQITANFVSNPFTAVVGQFNGLFSETNGVTIGTCGSFSLQLTKLGTYTATVLNDGHRNAMSGRFDAGGKAFNTVTRSGTNAFNIAWNLDFTGSDQITGTVGFGNWSADLAGDRALFNTHTNPCPYVSKYTFVLPGAPGAILSPDGNSYGTVVIGSNGVVTLAGYLADKTSVAKVVPVSKNGVWPLFVPLTSRKGVLISWVSLMDRPSDDFNGASIWLTPPMPTATYYRSGFSYAQTLAGSRYVPPVKAADRVLALTNGVATMSGGNLAGSYTTGAVPE